MIIRMKAKTATPMSLGTTRGFMGSALGRTVRIGRLGGGGGIGLLGFEAFDVLQGEHHFVAATDDGGDVLLVDDLEVDESGILFEGVAANHDGFGFALGADDRGVGLDLHALLEILRLRVLPFLHHLGLDGVLELFGKRDVLDHDIFDDEEGAEFLAGDFDRERVLICSRFFTICSALCNCDFLQGFLDARGDQALEWAAEVVLVKLHDGGLRNAEEDFKFDGLLEIGGVALGFVLGGLLADGDLGDGGDERGF